MPLTFNPFTGALDDAGQSKTGQIIIRSADQLAGTLRSDKVYFIDAAIDMGATSIEVPAGGLTIEGHGYDISSLSSSENGHSLFTSPVGGSGNVNITNITAWVTGTGSQIFDLTSATGNEAVELNIVNLGTFAAATTSLGELTGYRQYRMGGSAVIRPSDGLTFSGTWAGGFAINDSILLAIGAGVTVFKEGTSLLFQGSSISNLNALSIDPSTVVFDFQPSNFTLDQGFALNGARFNLASTPVPNMPKSSTKRFFRDCTGVEITFPGGLWRLTTTATTTIAAQDTPVKLAGTTTYQDLEFFTGAVDNAYQYESTITKDFRVNGFVQLDGGPNDVVSLIVRQWDDSASAYVDLQTFQKSIQNLLGGLDVADFVVFATATMDQNDRIELWVENNTDNSNVTAITGYLTMDVRQ